MYVRVTCRLLNHVTEYNTILCCILLKVSVNIGAVRTKNNVAQRETQILDNLFIK